MGTISRHSNAPFQNGETLDGGELEQDFNTLFTEINGSLDNANIAAAAAIAGSKLADASIPTAKLEDDAVTHGKLADNAATQVVEGENWSDASWTTLANLSWSEQVDTQITTANDGPGAVLVIAAIGCRSDGGEVSYDLRIMQDGVEKARQRFNLSDDNESRRDTMIYLATGLAANTTYDFDLRAYNNSSPNDLEVQKAQIIAIEFRR